MRFLLFLGMMMTVLAGCADRSVLPEDKIKTLTPQKILDLAAEKYGNYYFNEAVYYYEKVGLYFTGDSDDEILAKAWAKYEIAFIRYQENRLAEAEKLFKEVLVMKSPTPAPQILANQMLDKIEKKK